MASEPAALDFSLAKANLIVYVLNISCLNVTNFIIITLFNFKLFVRVFVINKTIFLSFHIFILRNIDYCYYHIANIFILFVRFIFFTVSQIILTVKVDLKVRSGHPVISTISSSKAIRFAQGSSGFGSQYV